jgi:hypothetical protein
MATAPSTEIQPIERDVLDHFKEGVGLRTIGLRTGLELSDVQEIVTETCGGDRGRAASLVAAYDRRHPNHQPVKAPPAAAATPSSPAPPAPAPAPAKRTPAKRAPAARRARTADDEPAAPTVVPVDLAEIAPADMPVTATAGEADPVPADLAGADNGLVWDRDDPETADDAEDPAPAGDPLGAPAGAAEAAQLAAEALPTVGHWGPDGRAADLPLAAAPRCTHGGDCTLHPDARGLHDYAVLEAAAARDAAAEAAALLDGPTEALPEVGSFEDLMAAVAGVPELAQLAGEVSTLVDRLHDRYDRERQARGVRAEAAELRRQLDTRIALLARLAGRDGYQPGAGETSHDTAAAA